MPSYEIEKGKLEVKLSPIEKLASLRWSVSVPLDSIRGATVDPKAVPKQLGLRAPGTGFPWLVAAGTFFKSGDRQFAFWKIGETPVIVELQNHKFARLILGTKSPLDLERKINQAIRN